VTLDLETWRCDAVTLYNGVTASQHQALHGSAAPLRHGRQVPVTGTTSSLHISTLHPTPSNPNPTPKPYQYCAGGGSAWLGGSRHACTRFRRGGQHMWPPMARIGLVWRGAAWPGLQWPGLASHGPARPRKARPGLARPPMARPGPISYTNTYSPHQHPFPTPTPIPLSADLKLL
jgi:hypothetical protein